MAYRWPTDPPGKAPAHTITWEQQQARRGLARTQAQTGFATRWGGYGKPTAPAPATSPALPGLSSQTPQAPPDPIYEQQMLALQRQRDQAIAGYGQQRSQQLGNYGFSEAGGALAFDPNNPFSKASLLKSNYDRQRRSTGQGMAAGGQLYSGAYQGAQDVVNRGQLQGEDALQKSLTAWLAQNTANVGAAGTAYDVGASQALGESTARIAQNPLYEPTAEPEDVGTARAAIAAQAKGYQAVPHTDSKGRRGVMHIYPDGRRVFVPN